MEIKLGKELEWIKEMGKWDVLLHDSGSGSRTLGTLPI